MDPNLPTNQLQLQLNPECNYDTMLNTQIHLPLHVDNRIIQVSDNQLLIDIQQQGLLTVGEEPPQIFVIDNIGLNVGTDVNCQLLVEGLKEDGEKSKAPETKPTHTCTFCAKTFEDEKTLKTHLVEHKKPFLCNKCDYKTDHKTRFLEHSRTHTGNKPYKCTQCTYRSASKKNLKIHEESHSNSKKPSHNAKKEPERNVCSRCGFLAGNKSAILDHRVSCLQNGGGSGKGKYSCVCDFDGKSLNSLSKHKVLCSILNSKFCCAICKWCSSSDQKILLHLIHHPQEIADGVVDLSVLKKYGIL